MISAFRGAGVAGRIITIQIYGPLLTEQGPGPAKEQRQPHKY